MNTRIFNDKNITKLDKFLEYLFGNGEKYVVSVRREKDDLIYIIRW